MPCIELNVRKLLVSCLICLIMEVLPVWEKTRVFCSAADPGDVVDSLYTLRQCRPTFVGYCSGGTSALHPRLRKVLCVLFVLLGSSLLALFIYSSLITSRIVFQTSK